MRKLIAPLVALVALTMLVASPASARVGAAGPGATAGGFATRVVVMQAGGTLDFVNLDTDPHNLQALAYGSDSASWCAPNAFPKGKCPRFWSKVTTLVEPVTPVLGVGTLAAGTTWQFECLIHANMVGELRVV